MKPLRQGSNRQDSNRQGSNRQDSSRQDGDGQDGDRTAGTPATCLDPAAVDRICAPLRAALGGFVEHYPGGDGRRQPVHTVYGGAHLFRADSALKLGRAARRHFDEYFPDPLIFARVLELPGHGSLPRHPGAELALAQRLESEPDALHRDHPNAWLAATVHHRVGAKLDREAVEDFRIDFEDGFGHRPDTEEDAEAVRAADEVARGLEDGTLPPFLGIRIKPFSEELRGRSIRTLDLFLTRLLAASDGRLPDHFVVTLPKVSLEEEVTALVEIFRQIETATGLGGGLLRLELMVETPQAILDARGRHPLPRLVAAADGRCVGAHFGIYDYTASLGVVAGQQALRHPVCDFARHVMQVTLAGTTVHLSDGATNRMPVGPHRATEGGLDAGQRRENREVVHRISKQNYDDVMHSLRHAFYQGWDLHPAQLGIRYAAVYTFFLEQLGPATQRLAQFVDKAAQATLLGDVFDDAATGQALLNFFLAGQSCGALSEEEAERTGLSAEELASRSFKAIVEGRREHAMPGENL